MSDIDNYIEVNIKKSQPCGPMYILVSLTAIISILLLLILAILDLGSFGLKAYDILEYFLIITPVAVVSSIITIVSSIIKRRQNSNKFISVSLAITTFVIFLILAMLVLCFI